MIARPYLAETRAEVTRMCRLPMYVVPTLAFPLLFYVFFGLLLGRGDGADVARYALGQFGAFGVVGAALFGFGVSVAVERAQGWMIVKRASPMPPLAFIVAKTVAAALFALIIVSAMSILAATVGGVQLSARVWTLLVVALVAGALPFCALGLAIGTVAGPNSAPAIVNLLYLPMSFLAGLWVPVERLPAALQGVAPLLPTYHLGRLALGVLGFGATHALEHVLALACWTIAGVAIAVFGLRADEGRTYG